MKKVLVFAAAAALVLASCVKTEISSNVANMNQVITFSNYVPRAITKANTDYYVVSGDALKSGKSFGVFSWAKTNETTPWSVNNNLFAGVSEGNPLFMNNIEVTFGGDKAGDDGSNNTYATRYWPAGDTPDGLSFFAYYPYSAAGLVLPTTALGDATFTVRDTAPAQIDFMVSDVVADQYYGHTNSTYASGAEGTVDLTFHHMLTKVKFIFKTDNTDGNTAVTLIDADLSGIYKKNTLTNTYTKGSAQNGGTSAHDWGTAESAGTFSIYVNGKVVSSTDYVTLTTGDSACVDGDVFLMVPQTITTGQQKITLKWTVATTGSATITNTKTIDLYDIVKSDNSHINWAKNSQVTYTITIGPKPIKFTATVDDWDSTIQNGSISVN